jgi:hypothetical protein
MPGYLRLGNVMPGYVRLGQIMSSNLIKSSRVISRVRFTQFTDVSMSISPRKHQDLCQVISGYFRLCHLVAA